MKKPLPTACDRILREFDDEEVEVMYTESFSSYGMGQAIMKPAAESGGTPDYYSMMEG